MTACFSGEFSGNCLLETRSRGLILCGGPLRSKKTPQDPEIKRVVNWNDRWKLFEKNFRRPDSESVLPTLVIFIICESWFLMRSKSRAKVSTHCGNIKLLKYPKLAKRNSLSYCFCNYCIAVFLFFLGLLTHCI